ncbi:cell division protein Sep4a [Coccidioides immitis RS]|uniref:Cell division protein Sep4a n=2 Tax=Coccidioides immitis TaxID=5501 RepID=A0A0E1RY34_COCIM|nr:cell division protein Sep4a [Coccidioides immitis RS]EAS35013.2 cell division protein Sep4a [Coccidioides immitis RS]KMP00224.1 Sep4a [Coccidioides immitis RMSCC 2394]
MAPTPAAPRTPGRSPPPDTLPAAGENGNSNNAQANATRRTSLGFLRRAKSSEKAKEEQLRRQREAAISKFAPQLPDIAPPPQLNTFGGENVRSNLSGRAGSYEPLSAQSHPPVPPIPFVDVYGKAESMAHRGRYSYASSAVSTINSPRRVRRRKDPTPYNILVIGTRNSGKTSFVNFLRKALALPPNKRPTRNPEEMDDLPQAPPNGYFTCHYLETEIDSERVGLTLWDSQGLERSIVDLQLREITGFLESKFEDSFTEEMKVIRSPGVRDTHIHCAFLILDPARLDENIAAAQKAAGGDSSGSAIRVVGGLDEDLDLQVLRTMQGKTTVVPVISKADTVTTAHMAFLKKTVWDSLKKANIDPLEVLTLEEHDDDYSSSLDHFDEKEEDELREAKDDANRRTPDSETVPDDPNNPVPPPAAPSAAERSLEKQRKRSSSSSMLSGGSNAEPFIPLSILSPDPHSLESKDGPIGRKFPWGFADPYDPEHCDFLKLKDTVFGEWRGELREASREVWYERWRTIRLKRNGSYGNGQA